MTISNLTGWVTSASQTVTLGILRSPRYVMRVHMDVEQAFNGSGADQIQIGHDDDNDAYATLTDVSTTGIKTVTLGVEAGYGATNRTVKAYYVNSAGEPSTGKCVVTIEFIHVPLSP